MADSARIQLAQDLQGRKDFIAETWYEAVAQTSFAPFTPAELRRRLAELTGQAIALLVTESFAPKQAQQIGAALVHLHYTQPEALGRTLGVLAKELVHGLPANQVVALQSNLAALLEGIGTGYSQQATSTLLAEQESIRAALVSELHSVERALQAARDHLEEEVAIRTADLRASEERVRELVENIDAIVFTLDLNGVITYVSPAVTLFFGRTPDEMVGRPYQEFVRAEDLSRTRDDFLRIVSGQELASDFRFLTTSGELRWAHVSSRPRVADGSVVGVHSVAMDITQRREAEEALQESEARWRWLVENAPDLILTVDHEGRIRFANRIPSGASLTLPEMLGREAWDFVLPDHRETVRAAIHHVLTTRTSTTYEAALQRVSGVRVWYAMRIGPLLRHGRVVGAMMIARNITERKRVEEVKDNLIRDVSHELRTPLAKAQLSLELLLEKVDRDPVDREGAVKFGRMALGNVHSLAKTVEVILDLTRLETGAKAHRMEPIRLADLIRAAILDISPLAEAKGLTLMAHVADDLPQVEGDREKLSRVLRNLMDNAIKFSSEGQIVVSAHGKPGEVTVSVSDQGCGILAENLERAFDRFFQERALSPGVGVGLPMCKTIVEAHNGRIWAESDGRGQGATLRFTLPCPTFHTTETMAP